MSTTTHRRVALRRCLASIAAVTIGLGGAFVSTTTAIAAPLGSPATPIDTSTFQDGRYVVQLVDDAAALYTGGIPNLQRTAPGEGETLDDADPAVAAYSAYLSTVQDDVAASVGADTAANLTLTINGFVADLTSDQAIELAQDPRVAAVTQDQLLQIQASPANEYLELEDMWAQVDGVEDAGTGVVIGVLDTGIAPENPLFAGEPLGTTPGDEPYWLGDEIVYTRGDGGTFRGVCQVGVQFDASMCSTKIVGARYFIEGFESNPANELGTPEQVPGEYVSPRDGDGHGSHTASTAAGNHDVEVTTEGGLEIGTMSGVAPEARIAVYKVCWSGPDPASVEDDGCSGADLMEGIEAAVTDGVDVINFSIGGGSAASVFEPYDVAFLGAAAAGIFVSASAGNSGPNPTTLDHASPWYTTVANTTIPNYEATVTYSGGAVAPGASVTVDPALEPPFSGELVYAGDVAAEGASAADAALCLPGSLDPDLVDGLVVLCDRGTNARVEKSAVVADAGGIGMILGNTGQPQSIDLDDHALPTVHIDEPFYADALAAARAGETVTFTAGNTTEDQTVAPIVAASSSRGPVNVDGNDVIKPDIAAPGTGIVAAGPNPAGEAGSFIFLSGTSMAAPHVAGLAAVYLGEHPDASPAEIKSALMTTATDTVSSDGSPNQDWFAQGAGFVNTGDLLDAGVYYANGTEDWYGYLRGLDYNLPDAWVGEAIDASDLNIPSIGIGALAGTQTVTRTLTALTPGTYQASFDAPAGVEVSVEPSSLVFDEVGDEVSYEVTFTVTEAAQVDAWATGSLTWTSVDEEPRTARSPIAVFPVTLSAPESVQGEGAEGSLAYEIVAGATGTVDLETTGLFAYDELLVDEGAAEEVFASELFEIGDELAHSFTLDSADDAADLDLYVQRLVDGEPVEQFVAATESGDESLLLEDPTPGTYVAFVEIYAAPAPTAFVLDHVAVKAAGLLPAADAVDAPATDPVGSFALDPESIDATVGDGATVTAAWSGLEADAEYLGLVTYSASESVRTYVEITVDAVAPEPSVPAPTEPSAPAPTDPTPTAPNPTTPPSAAPGPGDGTLPVTGGEPLLWLVLAALLVLGAGVVVRLRHASS